VVAVAGSLTAGAVRSPVAAAHVSLVRRVNRVAAAQLAPGDVMAPSAVTMQSPTTSQGVVANVHVPIAWKATDTGSGIGSYDVRVRSAAWNGAFGAFSTWKSATTATAASYTGSAGRTYCFSVRARDKSANLSSWSVDRCTSVPLDDTSLAAASFVRASRVGGAFLGTLSSASKRGATLTRTGVIARSITLVARTCPACGTLTVKWNGKTVKNLSLKAASATRSFGVESFAKPAKGTLQFVVTSNKQNVAIDAVAVGDPTLSGAVTLRSGATYTDSASVTVSAAVSGASGAVQMRLANGTAAGGAWTPFAASKPFTLSTGDGSRSVAAQFRDAGGNVSTVAVDSIALDTAAPVVDVTPGSTEVASGADVHVSATVTDASPLRSVTLETTPSDASPPTDTAMTLGAGAFDATVAGATESFEYTVIATDAAGNVRIAPATAPDVLYQVTVDAPPTSQDLIANALAAGTIDYPTSLEYRVWAQFNDPRLPDAYYAGNSDSGEDGTLPAEVQAELPSLPSDVQAAIAPYFERPSSASSPYGPEPESSAARRAAVTRPRSADEPPPPPPNPNCPTSWESDPGAHFRVWSCGIDDVLRQKVLAAAEVVYAPETGDMGPEMSDESLGDANGGDGLIDIYILDELQCRMRGDKCEAVPASASAITIPAGCIGQNPRQCSGFIEIGQSDAVSADMPGIIAHEFFHDLQMAHNYKAMFWQDGATPPVWHEHWFTEASASWAGWHYAHAGYLDRVNSRYRDVFQKQNTRTSLLAEGGLHDYASWVWPLFMQQEKSAGAIAGAWSDAELITTPQQFDDAISGRLDFFTHFRDFAVKNIDQTLTGDPFKTWQAGTEGADVVKDVTPQLTTTEEIGGTEPGIVSPVKIPVLAAQYDFYLPDDNLGKLTFDFTNVTNPDNLDIDVIGRVMSTHSWRRIQVDDKKLELCQDVADQDFDEMYVVLSNHKNARASDGFTPDPSQTIRGDYSVTVGDCDGVRAGISYNYSSSGTIPDSNVDQNYQENATFDLNMEPLSAGPGVPVPYELVDQGSTFSISTHYTLDSTDSSGCETLTTVDGSGQGTTPVTDPFHPSTIGVDAADPLDPFARGDTAVLTYVITYDEHGETVFSGPTDSCSNDTVPVDVTTQTKLFTCVQNSAPATLGGGLYGQFDKANGAPTFKFDCSANNLSSPFGVPGSLSVTGIAYLFNAGS